MAKQLTRDQIDFAYVLKERHELDIPFDILCDYDFGKKFIGLFSYDPEKNDLTGFRRVDTIINYLYYDKWLDHLQFKLDLSHDDVVFMIEVIAKYKFKGDIPRENFKDIDPELTAYEMLENKIQDYI